MSVNVTFDGAPESGVIDFGVSELHLADDPQAWGTGCQGVPDHPVVCSDRPSRVSVPIGCVDIADLVSPATERVA